MTAAIELEKIASLFEASPIPGAPFGLEVKVDLTAAFGPGEKELYVTVVKDPNDPQARGSVVRIPNDQN